MEQGKMKFVYWAVICKTPSCGLIPAKFLGPYDPKRFAYELPEEGPASWEISCAGCKKTYRYTRDDLQVKALDVLAPPTFADWW
jgi:hypothetical protein